MADVQILRSAVADVPAIYTVPGASEFTLKAVYAYFDGSGTGTDWIPAVTILSDSNHTVTFAADQAVSVVGGDDAEVSWFPGVKAGSAAATGRLPFLILQGILTSVANPPVGDSDHGKFDVSKKFTNAPTEWAYTLDGSGRIKEVLVDGPGLYDCTLTYKWAAPAAASQLDALINVSPSAGEVFNGVTMLGVSPDDSYNTTTGIWGTVRAIFPITHAGSIINAQPSNGGAAPVNFTPVYFTIIKHPLNPTS